MGSNYKMPTKIQAEELISGTNSTWTTLNGKNGRKFTSKTNTNKYIFIPASGAWQQTTHNNKEKYGYFWYSTSYSSDQTYVLFFFSNANISTGHSYRYVGLSVRAIN